MKGSRLLDVRRARKRQIKNEDIIEISFRTCKEVLKLEVEVERGVAY